MHLIIAVPVSQIQEPIVAVVKALFERVELLGWAAALCLAGGRMAAPPGGHSPGLPRPVTRSVDLVAAGLGSGNTLSRHTPISAFISQSFAPHPRSGRRLRRCAWVLRRCAIIAAAGPCVTSRLARHGSIHCLFRGRWFSFHR